MQPVGPQPPTESVSEDEGDQVLGIVQLANEDSARLAFSGASSRLLAYFGFGLTGWGTLMLGMRRIRRTD